MDPNSIGLCALALFVGGTVKGLAALGLPLVAIPLLTAIVGLKHAVAIAVIPMIGANLAQSFQGGMFVANVKKFAVLVTSIFMFTIIGTQILVTLPERAIELALGLMLIALPVFLLFRPGLEIKPTQRRWADPLVGAIAGILGGTAAYYGPPLMIYVLGMRLSKNEFSSGISLLYWVAALGIFIGMSLEHVVEVRYLALSVLMLIPAGAGMALGQRAQLHLTESGFARVLLAVYITTGASYLIEAWS